MEVRERDSLVHAWLGTYGINAMSVVLDHCFNKQAKSKYLKNAIMSKEMMENDACSESKEEIAVFEAKQRIKALKQQGLPESPM